MWKNNQNNYEEGSGGFDSNRDGMGGESEDSRYYG